MRGTDNVRAAFSVEQSVIDRICVRTPHRTDMKKSSTVEGKTATKSASKAGRKAAKKR